MTADLAGVGFVGSHSLTPVAMAVGLLAGSAGTASASWGAGPVPTAPALGMPLGANTLPFTGGNTMILTLAGLAPAGIGAGLLQLRRIGYQW